MTPRVREPRLLYVVTTPITARAFLVGQLAHFRELGWDVQLISSPGTDLEETARREQVSAQPLNMRRNVAPLQDLVSFGRLVRLMQRLRPRVINVGTPKAGLLAGLAGCLTGVPGRIYVLHGLRLEGAVGKEKAVLWLMEWLACRCAQHVVCVSSSLQDQVVRMRLCPPSRLSVLGSGSSNGVDTARFALTAAVQKRLGEIRSELAIDSTDVVTGFVGRLTGDKGLRELVAMHRMIVRQRPGTVLLVVGDIDADDAPDALLTAELRSLPGVHLVGQVSDVAPYYHVMDVVVLPTYREGYPNVILEAAAAGRPAVSTDATGAVDAIVHGVTGVTVRVGDAQALATAVGLLIDDSDLRRRMGDAAYERVRADFPPSRVWEELEKLYGSPSPVRR